MMNNDAELPKAKAKEESDSMDVDDFSVGEQTEIIVVREYKQDSRKSNMDSINRELSEIISMQESFMDLPLSMPTRTAFLDMGVDKIKMNKVIY